jgi:hypothetical protein
MCSVTCSPGYNLCGGACVPDVQEVCNGLDDNCDGAIDEGCGVGSCTSPFVMPPTGGSQMHSISGVGLVTTSCGGMGDDGIEMVYRWVPSRTGSAIFTTSGDFWPTALYVRTGSCEGAEIACAASLAMMDHPTVSVSAPVSAGVPYYIVVDSSHNTATLLTATLTVTAP